MQKHVRKYFEFAGGTTPLIVTFIGVLLMVLLVFPALPLSTGMIDVKLHYTPADIQATMLQYGPQGRAVHALTSATLDTLFPVLYVTFFAGLIYRFRPTERWWAMAFIPVFAGAWDLCENAQIITMLLQFPDLSAAQVAAASFFTTIKHLVSAIYALTALVFLFMSLVRRLRQNSAS